MGMCHQEYHAQGLGGDGCRTEQMAQPCGAVTGRESWVQHQETLLPPLTPQSPHTEMGCLSQKLTFSHTCSHWREGRRNSCSAFFKMPPLQEQEGEGRWRGGVRIGDWIKGRGPEALSSLRVWPTWQGLISQWALGTGNAVCGQPRQTPALPWQPVLEVP